MRKSGFSQLGDKSRSPAGTRNPAWPEQCFRRLLVDMHIPDWDERFLSRLEAGPFVETAARSGAQSLMVYTNSHVGPTLYPSEFGPHHRSLAGRDLVGEIVRAARERGLSVVAYYSAVYNNAAFLEHPDWRIVPVQGERVYETNRYGTCCPNSPYRDFAVAQTEELCRRYVFDGIFFDMLFWPYACFCRHCRKRFREEEGARLPKVIDWNNPVWMAFQRARERWMKELAGLLTAAVRRVRPAMTATHQLSPVLHDWRTAMPYDLTDECAYASGDFYGPPAHQSLACKIFAALSAQKPFEFMTSRCVDLWDHVTMKPPSKMEMQAFLAPAHGAAFMFIDAIDPDGTIHDAVHERIGRVFSQVAPYEDFLGGDLLADVAIYVSSESRFCFRANGTPLRTLEARADNMAAGSGLPHLDAAIGAGRALQEDHIPYVVVTRRNLATLGRYRVVILPNVLILSDEEIAAFRAFVAGGGALYASGYSSLVSETGLRRSSFGLEDVFGVSSGEMMEHSLAYFTPQDKTFAVDIHPQTHLIHRGGWIAVKNQSAKVLATLAKPWCPEHAGSVLRPSFASIHSSPPGPEPFAPGITLHRFRRGHACYAAGALEAEDRPVNRRVFSRLIRRLHGGVLPVEAEAPAFVEITVCDKADINTLNLGLVSLRQDEEPLPCRVTVIVRLGPKRKIRRLRVLPSGRARRWRSVPGGLVFDVPDFQNFALFALEYQPT